MFVLIFVLMLNLTFNIYLSLIIYCFSQIGFYICIFQGSKLQSLIFTFLFSLKLWTRWLMILLYVFNLLILFFLTVMVFTYLLMILFLLAKLFFSINKTLFNFSPSKLFQLTYKVYAAAITYIYYCILCYWFFCSSGHIHHYNFSIIVFFFFHSLFCEYAYLTN